MEYWFTGDEWHHQQFSSIAARPEFLSVGFILKEELRMETLLQIVHSMQEAAEAAHVHVTGDTKVVNYGNGDGLFINTAGIGLIEHNQTIAPSSIQSGDLILYSWV